MKKKTTKPDNDKSAETTKSSSLVLPFWTTNVAGHWEDASYANPYDKVYLGGLEVPGISDLKTSIVNSIDIQKSKGKSGSKIKYNGTELANITVTATIWMPGHITKYQQLLGLIQPGAAKKGLQPNIVPIQHPLAAALGILKVIVKEISSLEISDNGTAKFTIHLIQYEPPKNTKQGSKSNVQFQGSGYERTGAQQTDAERKATGTNAPDQSWKQFAK